LEFNVGSSCGGGSTTSGVGGTSGGGSTTGGVGSTSCGGGGSGLQWCDWLINSRRMTTDS